MNDLPTHKIWFHIDGLENGEFTAYFEQNGQRHSRLAIIELDEYEYFVGDSPISETISGYFEIHLTRDETVQRKCPYTLKLFTNLVRNQASEDIYKYVDGLKETLKRALLSDTPVQIDLPSESKSMGWHMTCGSK